MKRSQVAFDRSSFLISLGYAVSFPCYCKLSHVTMRDGTVSNSSPSLPSSAPFRKEFALI